MTMTPPSGPRVGRILADEERTARMASEVAFAVPDEVLRSAFAISARHILTAWHCVPASLYGGQAARQQR